MTRSKTQKPAEQAATPAVDPLADLRDPEDRYEGTAPGEGQAQPGEDRPSMLDDPEDLTAAVYQAVGAASVCWETMEGTGVFQEAQARNVAEDLLAYIAQSRPLVTQDAWDETVAEVVAAWHADPTSLGFLHKNNGTMCGCRYLARTALRAAMPVQPDADTLEPTEATESEAQDA